jgi:hypothetical protein
MLSALLGRSVPPERVPPDRLPDRHEQPPARTHRHKHELARAAAPCWNVERAAKFPPVPGQVRWAHPHDRDVPATGPPGPCRAPATSGIEPGRSRHGITCST